MDEPRCVKRTSRRTVITALVIVAVVAIIAAVVISREGSSAKVSPDVQVQHVDGGARSSGVGYTLDQFKSIKTGMSKARVKGIVGIGFKTIDQNLAGQHDEVFDYRNLDGSKMLLSFQNGILVQKAQSGLQ